MVYKKYIKRGGKVYGPYIYHSRRVDGKVVCDYHGSKSNSSSKKVFVTLFLMALVLLTSYLFVSNLPHESVIQESGSVEHANAITSYVGAERTPFYDFGEPIFFVSNSISNSVVSILKIVGLVTDDEGGEGDSDGGSEESSEESEESEDSEESSGEESSEGDSEETESSEDSSEESEESSEEESSEESEEVVVENDEGVEESEGNETEEIEVNETETEEVESNVTEETNQTVVSNETEDSSEAEVNESIANETVSNVTDNQTINETGENIAVEEENDTIIAIAGQNLTNISENDTVSNITEANATVKRARVVIGRPVKWVKKVTINKSEGTRVEVPKEAENITLKTGEEVQEALDELDEYEDLIEEADREEIVNGSITGLVSANIVEGGNFLTKFLNWLSSLTITSKAVSEEELGSDIIETSDSKIVDVEEFVNESEEVIIEYYTEPPQAFEKETNSGKEVVISAADELNYTDVLAYTLINESFEVTDSSVIQIFWREGQEFVDFDAYDLDSNSVIDYVEWIVPHLSNQTYDIILITDAQHLDENRTFIENVFELVNERDFNYSTIPAEHYLRVTFEENLTSENDITIYAKSNNSGSVEVYEKDGTSLVADFGTVSSDGKYRVLLTNLVSESQDVFDLKVVGELVEFDYVVDPGVVPNVSEVNLTTTNSATNDTLQNLTGFVSANDTDEDNFTLVYSWYKQNSSDTNFLVGRSAFIDEKDLLIYLPFNNDTLDYARDNDATNNGAVASSSGIVGGGYDFEEGDNDYMDLGDIDELDGSSGFTFASWIVVEARPDDHGAILSKMNDPANDAVYVEFDSNGNLQGCVKNGANSCVTTTAGTINASSTHFIVMVFNGSESTTKDRVRLYKDGVELSTSEQNTLPATAPSNAASLAVGCFDEDGGGCPSTGDHYDGIIDEVQVYNRSLGASEIRQLYLGSAFGGRIMNTSETSKGDNWTLGVGGCDSTICGNETNSSSLEILNSLPTIDQVILNSTDPTGNNTLQNLTLHIINVTDADNDTVKNITDWRTNSSGSFQSIAVLNMPFEAGSSNATDSKDYSTYSNNGTVSGATFNQSGGYDGFSTYTFDGVDDFINISNEGDFDFANNFSYGVWFRTSEASGNAGRTLVSKVQTSDFQWLMSLNDDGATNLDPNCQVYNTAGGSYLQVLDTTALNDGEWHHMICVFDSDAPSLTLYVDGVQLDQDTTTSGTQNTEGAAGVMIASEERQQASQFFQGEIDDVMIFNRSLSADQVLLLNNSRTDIIHSTLTTLGETWQACVTPNDNDPDGLEVCSNNITILARTANITNINVTNETGVEVAAGGTAVRKDNVTFNVTIDDPDSAVTSVLLQIWDGVAQVSTIIFQGLMSLVAGVWTLDVETNVSFPTGEVNFSVIVNDSSGVVDQENGTFNLTTSVPFIDQVILNATDDPNNRTSANLTGYIINATDNNGDNITFVYNWYKNDTLNATTFIENGAVLYLPFNNDTLDYALDNNGVLSGAVKNDSEGAVGTSVTFDGANDGVNVSENTGLGIGTGDVTVSTWIKSNSVSSISHIAGDLQGSGGSGYSIILQASGRFGFFIRSGGNVLSTDDGYVVDDDQWYHVATVFDRDGNGVRYVNGEQYGSTDDISSISGSVDNSVLFSLGLLPDNTQDFSGEIDEVQVHNRTLTSSEIRQLYIAGRDGGSVLRSEYLSVDDNWTLGVRAGDPSAFGFEVNSTTLELINNRPTIDQVILNSTDPTLNDTNQNLTGFVINVNDTNGDNVTLVYNWYKEGILNATSLIQSGVVAYWPFNNDSLDYVNNEDGTFVNGTIINNSGRVGGAAEFEESEEHHINLGDNQDLELDFPLTISTWINLESLPGTEPFTMFSKSKSTGNNREYIFTITTDDVLEFFKYADGSTQENLSANTAFSASDLGEWIHLAVSINSTGGVTFYRDGQTDGTSSFSSSTIFHGTAVAMIGAIETNFGSPIQYFDGKIDELIVYNRNLSSFEIEQLYLGSVFGEDGEGGRVMNSSQTVVGDNWTLGVIPVDFEEFGNEVNSSSLEILSAGVIQCQNLDTDDTVYTLASNVSSAGTCFNVTAENITLNCAGFLINYSQSSFGNAVNVSDFNNLTIRNCVIFQGSTTSGASAITTENSSDLLIEFNNITTFGNSLDGIDVSQSTVGGVSFRVNVRNNSVTTSGTDARGIALNALSPGSDVAYVNITDNLVITSGSSSEGVDVGAAGFARVIENEVNASDATAVLFNNAVDVVEIVGNVISSPSNNALRFSRSDGGTIENNTFIDSLTGLYFQTILGIQFSSDVVVSGNTFTDVTGYELLADNLTSNITFIDQLIGNYSVFDSNLSFRNSTFGEITFLNGINGTGLNLFGNTTSDIRFENNTAIVDETAASGGLNDSANITLFGIGDRGFSSPAILRNEIPCNDGTNPSCFNFTSLTADTVIFNVSSWSNYSIGEGSTDLTQCQDLNAPDTTYTLVNNVNSSGTCFTIGAENVTLDGAGFMINFSQASTGFGITNTGFNDTTIANVTIVNGNLTGSILMTGMSFDRTNNITITNNTIILNKSGATSDSQGIDLDSSLDALINSNNITVRGEDFRGIRLFANSHRGNITGNNFFANETDIDGIFIEDSNDVFIQNNNFTMVGTASEGMLLDNADFIVVDGNNITTTEATAITMTGTDDANLTNNFLSPGGGNVRNGMTIVTGAERYLIENNIFEVNSITNSKAIRVDPLSDSTIRGNNITSTAGGFSLEGASIDNIIDNNRIIITGNSVLSFIQTSADNNITNNHFNMSGAGTNDMISFSASSHTGLLINNTIINEKTGGSEGVIVDTVKNYTIINNTILVTGGQGIVMDDDADGFTIRGNNITGGDSGASSPIRLSDVRNGLIEDNELRNRGGSTSGIILIDGAHNNTIKNNRMTETLNDIFVFSTDGAVESENNTLQNNTILSTVGATIYLLQTEDSGNGTILIDQYIGNYSIPADIFIVVNDTNFGEIRFLEPINGTANNLSNDIRITNNSVFVNETISSAGLNSSANITLLGITTAFIDPVIFRNDVESCNTGTNPSCFNFTTLNASSVRFNVSSWSEYEIGEGLPTIAQVILNATDNPNNLTTANLTGYVINLTDGQGDNVSFVYNWYKTNASGNFTVGRSVLLGDSTLEGYWPLNNDTLDYDDTNDGTVNGTTLVNATGRVGGGAHFDGNSDYITLSGSGILDATSAHSISLWIKTLDNANQKTYSQGNSGDNLPLTYIQLGNSGEPLFHLRNDAGTFSSAGNSSTGLGDGEWHHLVGVRDTSSPFLEIYVDGVPSGTSATNPTGAITFDNSLIGAGNNNGFNAYFNGSIDEVQVYSKALSFSEVTRLYLGSAFGEEGEGGRVMNTSETNKGDNWTLGVVPIDFAKVGFEVNSSSLEILNSLPSIDQVILNATTISNFTDDNLTLHIINVTDADNDTVKNITDWRINESGSFQSIAVLNMPFEAGSSNGTDSKDYSTYSNNGTVSGATFNQSGGYDGFSAYEFDGIDDNIVISDNPEFDFGVGNFTVSVWAKPENNNSYIFHRRDGSGNNEMEVFIQTSGNLYFSTNDGSNVVVQYPVTTFGTYRHWVFSRNDTALSIYENGTLVNVTTGTPQDVSGSGSFFIGSSVASSALWNGSFDEFQVWNRSLSAEQVSALYNNRTDLIVSQETVLGETWQACVTPNDNDLGGNETCSNNVTILGTPNITDIDVINETAVEDGIVQRGDNVTFNVTISDPSNLVTSVLLQIWDGVVGVSNVIFAGLMSLVAGVWTLDVDTNETFPLGELNFTVTVNASSGEIDEQNGTFNLTRGIPRIAQVTLDSTDATINDTNQNLTGNIINAFDGDGDNITFVYKWYKGGVLNATSVFIGDGNLSLYLPLNNDSLDYANDNNGTISGAVGATGRVGGAYSFDGNDDNITVANEANFDFANNVSISVWMFKAGAHASYGGIVAKSDGGSANGGYLLAMDAFDSGSVDISAATSTGNAINRRVPVSTGVWTHVVAVIDTSQSGADRAKLYINGVEENGTTGGSGSFTTMGLNNFEVLVGDAHTGDRYFNGTLDEIQIYNKSLTAFEVQQLYFGSAFGEDGQGGRIMDSNQTVLGDSWTLGVVPVDFNNTGVEVISNAISIINLAPNITLVDNATSFGGGVNPTEAGNTTVSFEVRVLDPNGVDDINDSSVIASFSRTGEATRSGNNCSFSSDIDSTTRSYTCSIDMRYFDGSGTWDISVSAEDNQGQSVTNNSRDFQYNELKAIVISPNLISFSQAQVNATNVSSDSPTVINNTGNFNATGNVSVNAINLLGETNPNETINANNFSIDIDTDCGGVVLQNATDVLITNSILDTGDLDTGQGKEELYHCINLVPNLSVQTFSTSTGGSWTIKIG